MLLQITCRNFKNTESIKYAVKSHAEKLENLFDSISRCHVIISEPHRRQSQGKKFHIEIELSVPGKRIVVSRETEKGESHELFSVALKDAFKALEHQLETYVAKLRVANKRKDHLLHFDLAV